MRRFVLAAACVCGMAVSAPAARADRVVAPVADAAAEQTVWTGTFRRTGRTPDGRYVACLATDTRLIVTRRDGEAIRAELWTAGDSLGLALRGTLGRDGSLRLKATKALKGDWPDDLIGRATLAGSLKRGWFRFGYETSSQHSCRGDFQLRRPYAFEPGAGRPRG